MTAPKRLPARPHSCNRLRLPGRQRTAKKPRSEMAINTKIKVISSCQFIVHSPSRYAPCCRTGEQGDREGRPIVNSLPGVPPCAEAGEQGKIQCPRVAPTIFV